MNEILLYGHSGSGNHGCEAIVRSTRKVLEEECVVYSNSPEQDAKYGIVDNIKKYSNSILQHSFRRYFYAVFCRIFKHSMIRYKYMYRPFLECVQPDKIYLSIGGDHYCYGNYSNHIYDYLNNYIKSKGAKSVLWSCSIEGKDLDEHTINSLKKYDLITARESITFEMLKNKGIEDNVVLIPDVAFQLEAKETELPELFNKSEIIGINMSPMIQKYGKNAKMIFLNYKVLIEHILENTKCSIALIPHVVWNDTDDRKPLSDLYNIFKDTGRVVLIDDMEAKKLKYVISKSCFFIGARTHATIAAYSMCVPTLVVGYSVKARGIAKDIFGKEDGFVIPVQSMNEEDDLRKAFEKLWDQRDKIKQHLECIMPQYCARVFEARALIEKL